MRQSDTPAASRSACAPDPAAPHPFAALLNLIGGLLTPLFLGDQGLGNQSGDAGTARRAAVEAMTSYRPRTHAELVKIGQIIAFGMAVLDTLRLSMSADVTLAMKLRLRCCANGLSRSAQQLTSALERNRREDAAVAAHPGPLPAAELPEMDLDDMMMQAQGMLRDLDAQVAGIAPNVAPTPAPAADARGAAHAGSPVAFAAIRPNAPLAGAPLAEAPVDEAWVDEGWAVEAWAAEAGMAETPVCDAPVGDAPMGDAHACDAPVIEAGVSQAPLPGQSLPAAPGPDAALTDAPVSAVAAVAASDARRNPTDVRRTEPAAAVDIVRLSAGAGAPPDQISPLVVPPNAARPSPVTSSHAPPPALILVASSIEPAGSQAPPPTTKASARLGASVARNIPPFSAQPTLPPGLAWNADPEGQLAWSSSMRNVATGLLANLSNVPTDQQKADMMWAHALLGTATELATKGGRPPASAKAASTHPKRPLLRT